jgi:AraC-like DNA-binding protein
MVISRQKPETGTFSSSYLTLFLERLVPDPEMQARLFDSAGLTLEALDRPTLNLDQVDRLVRAMDRQLEPGWHIPPSLQLEASQHGPLGLAAISAPTLGDALATLTRFERLRAPWAQAIGYREADRYVLELQQRLALPDCAALMMEMNLLALAGLITQLMGSRREHLCFQTPERALPWLEALERALPGPVELGRSRFALTLPAEDLSRVCLLADAELHALMLHRCQRLLRNPGDGTTVAQVRAMLVDSTDALPTLDEVARTLGRSARSLSRHLAEEGSSFRELVDATRLARARELLRHSRLPINDIAWRLGYADPSNFNRAFRRWTGRSPGEERNRKG